MDSKANNTQKIKKSKKKSSRHSMNKIGKKKFQIIVRSNMKWKLPEIHHEEKNLEDDMCSTLESVPSTSKSLSLESVNSELDNLEIAKEELKEKFITLIDSVSCSEEIKIIRKSYVKLIKSLDFFLKAISSSKCDLNSPQRKNEPPKKEDSIFQENLLIKEEPASPIEVIVTSRSPSPDCSSSPLQRRMEEEVDDDDECSSPLDWIIIQDKVGRRKRRNYQAPRPLGPPEISIFETTSYNEMEAKMKSIFSEFPESDYRYTIKHHNKPFSSTTDTVECTTKIISITEEAHSKLAEALQSRNIPFAVSNVPCSLRFPYRF